MGDNVFDHLNGMFGLVIWDVKKKALVLGGMPWDIKLIYYRSQIGNWRRVEIARYPRGELETIRLIPSHSISSFAFATRLLL